MFPAIYTHYYWEEKREEIYRSAPTRTRTSWGGIRRGARGRRQQSEVAPAECLRHGPTWAGYFEQLIEGLCGRVLPSRPDFKEQLASIVCSCDDRDREKCRLAACRLGYRGRWGSNLPRIELNDRMRFNELYFHNILNSPQFTSEYIESCDKEDPVVQIIQGLYASQTAIFTLVQRCVIGNDLKSYRLLDIIRLYTQKPNNGRFQLPLPVEEDAALEILQTLEKGDHMNLVAKLFACQIVLGLSNDASPPMLELNLATANLNDIKGVQKYFQQPFGYKDPMPKPSKLETESAAQVDSEPTEATRGEVEGEPSASDSHNKSELPLIDEIDTDSGKKQNEENIDERQATVAGEKPVQHSVSENDNSTTLYNVDVESVSGAGSVTDPSDAATKTNTQAEVPESAVILEEIVIPLAANSSQIFNSDLDRVNRSSIKPMSSEKHQVNSKNENPDLVPVVSNHDTSFITQGNKKSIRELKTVDNSSYNSDASSAISDVSQ